MAVLRNNCVKRLLEHQEFNFTLQNEFKTPAGCAEDIPWPAIPAKSGINPQKLSIWPHRAPESSQCQKCNEAFGTGKGSVTGPKIGVTTLLRLAQNNARLRKSSDRRRGRADHAGSAPSDHVERPASHDRRRGGAGREARRTTAANSAVWSKGGFDGTERRIRLGCVAHQADVFNQIDDPGWSRAKGARSRARGRAGLGSRQHRRMRRTKTPAPGRGLHRKNPRQTRARKIREQMNEEF